MRGIIIGAGIGGLSTAIALQKKNIDVRVFDSAPRLSPVGAGIRFGFVQIADEQVYWFATQCENSGGKDNAETIKQELLEKYKDFFEPIPEIISSTASAILFRHDIYDLQSLKKWHENRLY